MNNPFELMDLLKEVLEDIDFSINDPSIISVGIDVDHRAPERTFKLCVQLVGSGFERFMSCVRARVEHIGEEVREPVREPMEQFPDSVRASWHGVPGLEFMAIMQKGDE